MNLGKVSPPIFTLRGHNVGVSALVQVQLGQESYLISGDEEGTLVVWNVATFKRHTFYTQLLKSRIQSLHIIEFDVTPDVNKSVLFVQTRDHGITVFNTDLIITNLEGHSPKPIITFTAHKALFSKSDVWSIDKKSALIAYPSSLENYLVTVRVLDHDLKTSLSGSARRNFIEGEKTCSVFDISIKLISVEQYHLFVAYEDGKICLFHSHIGSTTSVPVLNTSGLKIDMLRSYDLKISDFVSAFDVTNLKESGYISVIGSPMNKLVFLLDTLNDDAEPVIESIILKTKGVSAIRIRPDKKLVAVSGWDSKVRLFSMKSQKPLAVLKHHTKQVQSMLFLRAPDNLHISLRSITGRPCDSGDNRGKYLLCCASMEGTISISEIY